MPKPTTIDFESFAIKSRPVYPPVPVSVSIKPWGKAPKFYSWGHITNNNCGWEDARNALLQAYACKDGVLFQNAKFDLDVADVHFNIPVPSWDRVHDTMLLLFLDDPHQIELGLKPSAARLLDMPPEEQDAVADWLILHQPVPGVKISRSKQSDHYFAKYLAMAPGDLVGKYADGDVIRTEKLFELLWAKTVERGMKASYDRERRLMPILLEMERQGIMTDHTRLTQDVEIGRGTQQTIDSYLLKRLKADINLDSGEQLVKALVDSGEADPTKIALTKTGKFKSDKASLGQGIKDPALSALLKYRTQLKTCVGTFMDPWAEIANAGDGRIFTTWNQIKGTEGGSAVGTRTGRLSASWFMNMPKEFDPLFEHEAKGLPKCPVKGGLPPLPSCRSYIVPFDGDVLIDRDYSQQEPRILGHFEGGALMEQYLENPWIDFHDNARDNLQAIMGRTYSRKPVKNINLGLIYGQGVGSLAIKNNSTVEETTEIKNAILSMYPGLKDMYKDMKLRAKSGTPIRTWGGREYYCEEPKLVDGRLRTFDYKLVNVLVQGSAADCTKEAIIRYDDAKGRDDRLILNVHDQLTVSTPKGGWKKSMETLRQAMEGVEFDVPMKSEGSWSPKSWADLVDYDKKGVLCDGNN